MFVCVCVYVSVFLWGGSCPFKYPHLLGIRVGRIPSLWKQQTNIPTVVTVEAETAKGF